MKPYIIAECGTSHQAGTDRNRFIKALDYCVKAADAGADCVKFQLFIPNEPLFCPMPGDDARWDRWADSIMSEADWYGIKEHAELLGMDFLVSVFQHGALDMAKRLGCKRIKVASRAIRTFPYDKWDGEFIASLPFLNLHWGCMSKNEEDRPAGSKGYEVWNAGRMKLMYCLSKYPTPLNEAEWIDDKQEVSDSPGDHGLSDHSGSPWPAIDAMARGCPMVELHVDGMPGSITWDQLKLVCEARDAFAQMRPN